MWDHRYLTKVDTRALPLILVLMWISVMVISSTTAVEGQEGVLSPMAKMQIQWFGIGWCLYFFCVGLDYRKFRSWVWPFYLIILLLLVGLFFTAPVANVQRWYRLPILGRAFQPSEYAKLAVVLALSFFLEHKGRDVSSKRSAWQALLLVFIPFVLILKQPDLGTALVLYPIALVIFYFGGIHRLVVRWMAFLAVGGFIFVSLMFTGVLSHDKLRPFATKFLKEYQYERLNPNTYHQKASQTAISLGGMTGSGLGKSEFTGRHFLPEAHTDSVFASFSEEFGLIGVFFLLLFFFGLLYFSFQVVAVAPDPFGRLLAAGLSVYLAVHMIVNIGMMSGFLPITGVPLVLITYGGSSTLSTMMALGILQSIYSRRYMFA